jgi:hypothetical protein
VLLFKGGKYTEEEEVCQYIYVTLTLLRYKWREQSGFVPLTHVLKEFANSV